MLSTCDMVVHASLNLKSKLLKRQIILIILKGNHTILTQMMHAQSQQMKGNDTLNQQMFLESDDFAIIEKSCNSIMLASLGKGENSLCGFYLRIKQKIPSQ